MDETPPRFWLVDAESGTRDTWVYDNQADDVGQALAHRVASEKPLEEPVRFTVDNRGKRQGDLLHTCGGFNIVASERLCAVLTDIGATGWASVPVEISHRNGEELPGYRVLAPTGRCADLRTQVDTEAFDSQPVDPSIGWDGSDVFWWEAPAMSVFVTDRVRVAFEAAKLQRISFGPPAL